MSPPRSFRSFAEFEREYLRPTLRVGQTIEELLEDSAFEAEFDLEREAFEDDECCWEQ
ncbi:MAG: transcriptional regulator [Deltaproteobacteria bacterium]|nr:transcriptional regulator [Deltaproteobacteria bacterium]